MARGCRLFAALARPMIWSEVHFGCDEPSPANGRRRPRKQHLRLELIQVLGVWQDGPWSGLSTSELVRSCEGLVALQLGDLVELRKGTDLLQAITGHKQLRELLLDFCHVVPNRLPSSLEVLDVQIGFAELENLLRVLELHDAPNLRELRLVIYGRHVPMSRQRMLLSKVKSFPKAVSLIKELCWIRWRWTENLQALFEVGGFAPRMISVATFVNYMALPSIEELEITYDTENFWERNLPPNLKVLRLSSPPYLPLQFPDAMLNAWFLTHPDLEVLIRDHGGLDLRFWEQFERVRLIRWAAW
ncbi:hypothetical protein DFJ74DRAFT_661538 [Hyaloraphidium curvatum]|nr:hypothetical protein DFJ74DRAFT_661538 [Hyaloraphidium curvatum]